MSRFLFTTAAAIMVMASICHGSPTAGVARQFEATDYPTGLAWDGTFIWLADRDSEWLYAVDPSTGAHADSVLCPSFSPTGLAFGDGFLWVSGYYEDGIYKVDVDAGRVVDVIGAPGPLTLGLAWQDG